MKQVSLINLNKFVNDVNPIVRHIKILLHFFFSQERLQRFVPRLVQLLAEWTETFPYDFRDERVMCHVRSITQKVAAVDAAARQEVSALLQNLLLRLTALERYEEGLARLATEAAAEQLTQVNNLFISHVLFNVYQNSFCINLPNEKKVQCY